MTKPALIPELLCSDHKKSLGFYVELLGFRILYDRPEESFAMLERQGAFIMIEQYDPNGRWNIDDMAYPFGRGINFQIETMNISTLYASLASKKLEFFMPLEEKWYKAGEKYFGNKQFLIQDPDGYLLRFFEDLGEKESLE